MIRICTRDNEIMCAGVAQLVEQLTCNQPVGGSTPLASSIFIQGFKVFWKHEVIVLFESRALEGGANSLRSKLSHWRVAPIARRVSERSSRILLSPAPFSLNVPSLSRKTIHCCMTQKVTTLWGRALSRCMRSNILRIVLVLVCF